MRTQRALDSALSDGQSVPHLVLDQATPEEAAALAQFCRERGVSSVITGAESGVPLAEALKVELGLASAKFQNQGRRFWDKDILYAVVQAAGLRVPQRYGLITAAEAESRGSLRAVLDECGIVRFPVVVKPDVGAGSVGVRVVHDAEQATKAVDAIIGEHAVFGNAPAGAIVQEFVQGREYVIDTVTHRGVHRVLSLCTYDKHPSSTGNMVYDRLRWLAWDVAESAQLRDFGLAVLDVLDHREGAVHLEVIVDDNGPCLIDLGARPHGAGHPMKTYALTGTSQLHSEVGVAAGQALPEVRGYELNHSAAIEFLSVDSPARIRDNARPDALLDCDFVLSGTVLAKPGRTYPETQSLLDSLALGLVFLAGDDDATVAANARKVRDAFSLMIKRGVGGDPRGEFSEQFHRKNHSGTGMQDME